MPEVKEASRIVTPIRYRTGVQWTKGHQGTVGSENKLDVSVVCPRSFCHERDDVWSHEEFFVSAAEMCLMMTFLLFAERGELSFLSYKSHAEGQVDFVDGKAMFTRIDIYPTLEVTDARLQRKVGLMLKAASRNCLISQSIKTVVEHHPEIIVRDQIGD